MAVIHRAHTTSNIAPAIRKLKKQVDEAYPNRDHASDGIWPSAAHTAANPNSDHEAGNALDLDDDLSATRHVDTIVEAIVASKDARLKYVIHNGRIWTHDKGWHAYTGSNPHTKHAHFSVYEARRDDVHDWSIRKPPRRYPGRPYKKGDRGANVLWIKKRLAAKGYKGFDLKSDVFGAGTAAAVLKFRKATFPGGDPEEPVVGENTWKALAK